MNLIIENIQEIQTECKYSKCLMYDNETINCLYNNWKFLSENGQNIKNTCNVDIISILYSEYYWSARFTENYRKKYGYDAGFEQNHFKADR